ncbi:hypothetical protein AYL99_00781 [Fonsecaea erecta]|uniref:Uncharacterized protein n=1 Tax=Fonsecaea erecta TaxID=1367422 RepID=A0A178ZYE1_9EURO|nr:hypothetical protein AYL99_00781 [Fonsecaea erecta]OAP64809.1 hypothetical protein AYL99_00781 [Fonsecaea erecta]
MEGTEAATGLGKAVRMSRGQQGGIVRAFYACAFLPPVGKSLVAGLGGLPPWVKEEASKRRIPQLLSIVLARAPGLQEDGSTNATTPEQVFYNDLPAEEQKYWLSKLKHHSSIATKTPLTQVGYTNISVLYPYCEDDQALPLPMQEMMVEQSGLKDMQDIR